MRIYDLLKVASRLVAALALIMFIWYIWNAIRNIFKRESTSPSAWFEDVKLDMQRNGNQHKWAVFLACSILAYLITNSTVHQLVGIHDLELKPTGTYCFYVEVYREEEKTYTLPAQIRVDTEYYDINPDETEVRKVYYIEKVFFSNGGWLDFKHEDSVGIDEPSWFYGSDEEEWHVKLLNEHAYSPYVTETNNAETGDIIRMFAETVPILFLLCACLVPLKETERVE